MKKPLLLAAIALGSTGCGDLFFGSRIGTDPASASSETAARFESIRSRRSADSVLLLGIDTLDAEAVEALPLPLPESTWIAAVALDRSRGAWLSSRDTAIRLRPASPWTVRATDAHGRAGWTLELPGTGSRAALRTAADSAGTVLEVFADSWPLRIARADGSGHLSWWIDAVDLTSPLELDLTTLPDSSCAARITPEGSISCIAP